MENFNPKEYRKDLADKLREIRTTDKDAAVGHLEEEKQRETEGELRSDYRIAKEYKTEDSVDTLTEEDFSKKFGKETIEKLKALLGTKFINEIRGEFPDKETQRREGGSGMSALGYVKLEDIYINENDKIVASSYVDMEPGGGSGGTIKDIDLYINKQGKRTHLEIDSVHSTYYEGYDTEEKKRRIHNNHLDEFDHVNIEQVLYKDGFFFVKMKGESEWWKLKENINHHVINYTSHNHRFSGPPPENPVHRNRSFMRVEVPELHRYKVKFKREKGSDYTHTISHIPEDQLEQEIKKLQERGYTYQSYIRYDGYSSRQVREKGWPEKETIHISGLGEVLNIEETDKGKLTEDRPTSEFRVEDPLKDYLANTKK